MQTRKPMPHGPPDPHPRSNSFATLIMVASTAMSAAFLSGLLLGSFMCALILFCRRYRLDPDNIAPAVASCLGDLITLCMIGLVSALLIPFLHTPLPFIVGVASVAIAAACLVYTLRNEHVRGLLWQGWSPLLGAMMISSATGMILDVFVSKYEGFAMLAVVISGTRILVLNTSTTDDSFRSARSSRLHFRIPALHRFTCSCLCHYTPRIRIIKFQKGARLAFGHGDPHADHSPRRGDIPVHPACLWMARNRLSIRPLLNVVLLLCCTFRSILLT
jgi:cation transporter-like permease